MDISVLGLKQYTRIENSKKEGDVFAVCDILVNSWLEVKNIRIVRGEKDTLSVRFPQLKTESPRGSGHYHDVLSFHDINIKKEIEKAVLSAYQDRLLNGLFIEDNFKITVTLNKHHNERMKARVSIALEGVEISGITIWQGKKGLLVSMPQRQMHNPITDTYEWVDLIYPTNFYQKKRLIDKIIDAYELERERTVKETDFLKDKMKETENDFEPANDPSNPFLQMTRGN